MNIIDALRTGRPLRRVGNSKHAGSQADGWLGNQYVRDLLVHDPGIGYDRETFTMVRLVNEEDLLADDWEVQDGFTVCVKTILPRIHVCPKIQTDGDWCLTRAGESCPFCGVIL